MSSIKTGSKGSAGQRLDQLPEAFKNIHDDLSGLLSKSDYTVPKKDLYKALKESVLEKPGISMSDKDIASQADKYLTAAFKGTGKDLSATDIYNIKSYLAKEVKFDALNPTDAQLIGEHLFESSKGMLDNVSPEIRVLNHDQNMLYQASKDLVKTARADASGKLTVLGTNIPSRW